LPDYTLQLRNRTEKWGRLIIGISINGFYLLGAA
jgi:hypothetical protein